MVLFLILISIETFSYLLLSIERKARRITTKYQKDEFLSYKNTDIHFDSNLNKKNWKMIDQKRILYRNSCKITEKKYKEKI